MKSDDLDNDWKHGSGTLALIVDALSQSYRKTLVMSLSSQNTPDAPTPLPSCAACPDRAAPRAAVLWAAGGAPAGVAPKGLLNFLSARLLAHGIKHTSALWPGSLV